MKSKRGGFRKGAGRKPIYDTNLIKVTLGLTQPQVSFLKTKYPSVSEGVREIVQRGMRDD